MSDQPTLFAGIDAGGTKTRLAYCFSDDLSARYFEGRGVNVKRDGIEKTVAGCAQVINEGCNTNLLEYRLVLCAGIAGAGRAGDRAQIALRIKEVLALPDSASITIVTDADIAYHAAHDENSGILIIIGTGSIILAKTRGGQFVRAGGWGYLLGDEAGGFRLAQAGLEAVANAFDGGPATLLKPRLQDAFGIDSGDALIKFAYDNDAEIQQITPLVVEAAEAGDAVASQIFEDQVRRLVDRLSWLLEKHLEINGKICLTGGLSANNFYKTHLISKINNALPHLEFSGSIPTPHRCRPLHGPGQHEHTPYGRFMNRPDLNPPHRPPASIYPSFNAPPPQAPRLDIGSLRPYPAHLAAAGPS